jgi:hypothetical protein
MGRGQRKTLPKPVVKVFRSDSFRTDNSQAKTNIFIFPKAKQYGSGFKAITVEPTSNGKRVIISEGEYNDSDRTQLFALPISSSHYIGAISTFLEEAILEEAFYSWLDSTIEGCESSKDLEITLTSSTKKSAAPIVINAEKIEVDRNGNRTMSNHALYTLPIYVEALLKDFQMMTEGGFQSMINQELGIMIQPRQDTHSSLAEHLFKERV